MLFAVSSWRSPCAPGAEGPLTLKGSGEGLGKMLSGAFFSRWAKKLVLKIKRFKSLPFLENTIPGYRKKIHYPIH